MISVSCYDATSSCDCQPKTLRCPLLNGLAVCSNYSSFTLSLKHSYITRYDKMCIKENRAVHQSFRVNTFIFILQRLRSQSVLDLLSALSTSPGGETGFDKLAAGFRSVVPVLTQALTDELNVLSRLAGPHTVLGFLSAAYLSTIAQELSSLMEKECEMALRDNTSSYKVKKYSAKYHTTAGRCLFNGCISCCCFGPQLLPPFQSYFYPVKVLPACSVIIYMYL